MKKTVYFKVAISLPLTDIYTYGAPEHLRPVCVPGMRVLVPLGRRRVTGYIVGKTPEKGPYQLKNILDVLDDMPLFHAAMVPFFQWIANYYIHPVGEVIKSALPSGLNRHDVKSVLITPPGREFLETAPAGAGERLVLEQVAGPKPVSLKQLQKKLDHPSIQSLLRSMEKRDLIRISSVLKKDGIQVKQEKFIRSGNGAVTPLRMSLKRKKILEIVGSHQEISLTALKQEVPTAAALIKPLAESGHVEIELRQVFRDPLGDPVEPDQPPELTKEQAGVISTVKENLSGFQAYLLNGVTGSGKTEVYLHLVKSVIDDGHQAIVLVPEISLISQTERRFRARFGSRIAVIHSALTAGERLDQWRKICLGKVDVVIGARSCIFAPVENPGLIIVDEEHDGSYKQETGLRYNARDLAVVRARQAGCPVILGSATPSVQSHQNVVLEKFKSLCLTRRVNQRPLPEIQVVDLKKYKDAGGLKRVVTPELVSRIRKCLDRGEQALIFLNRRGFASSPVCRDCGESLSCRHCDVTLTLHKNPGVYKCHLCGYALPANAGCTACGSPNIKPLGFGTERIESTMKELFPDARVARMDQDTTAAKGAMIRILKNIRNRNVDIIVGTQMLAKGHDFPFITLVGIVCADLSLSLPDFRAGERTFQLLAQVAGRAGRGNVPGKVVMQTYNPDHFIIEASRKQDFQEFFNNETPFRKALMYPPFSRMVQIKISGMNAQAVSRFANRFAGSLHEFIEKSRDLEYPVQVLGPIEAAIGKISSRFRWQILVKSPSSQFVNQMLKTVTALPENVPGKGCRLVVDVDPYFLM